jgi:SpoVK/Ycf46/Vps4 family AAA+-type ATPase
MFSNNIVPPPNPEIFKSHFENGLKAIKSGERKEAIIYLDKAIEAQMARVEAERDPKTREQLKEILREVVGLYEDLAALPDDASLKQKPVSPAKKPSGGTSTQSADQGGLQVERFLIAGTTTKFDDIVGHQAAKDQFIHSMIMPFKHPEKYTKYQVDAGGMLLLFGPSGTGKTELAAAAANELGADFYNVAPADLIDKWVGDAEKNVKALFEGIRARSKQTGRPAVLFIDECSALLTKGPGNDGGVQEKVVSEFQTQIDGIKGRNKEDGTTLFFVGATNYPGALSPAMLSRFNGPNGDVIYAGLPNKDDRKRILQLKSLSTMLAEDVDFDVLAEKTEGYSGRELVAICKKVNLEGVKRSLRSGHDEELTQEMYLEQIGKRSPSTRREEVAALEAWAAKHASRES